MWVRLVLVVRTAWWHLGWGLFARIWCPRLACTGLERVPQGPVILAANHASHADTVILQLLLVRKGRRKVLVAGAADYWFRNPALGLLARFLGVFPFPRSGGEGVGRACKALRRGWSVLIFPQGTRSGGPFRGPVEAAELGCDRSGRERRSSPRIAACRLCRSPSPEPTLCFRGGIDCPREPS